MRRVLLISLCAVFILSFWSVRSSFSNAGGRSEITCGDVNGDGVVDISDPTHILNWLFLGGPELVCAEPVPDCALSPEECEALRRLLEEESFGRRVAGGFMATFAGSSDRFMIDLSPDGRMRSFDSNDLQAPPFGELEPVATVLQGVWRRVAERDIAYEIYGFLHDRATEHAWVYTWRVSGVFRFNEDFSSFESVGDTLQEFFAPEASAEDVLRGPGDMLPIEEGFVGRRMGS